MGEKIVNPFKTG